MKKVRYCTCGGPVQVERDGTRICAMCYLRVQPGEIFLGKDIGKEAVEEAVEEAGPSIEISEEEFMGNGADFFGRLEIIIGDAKVAPKVVWISSRNGKGV